MVKFEEKMRESTTLFKEEQRILDISRRLSEQNEYVLAKKQRSTHNIDYPPSQILELLHELNRCPQVPPRLRYDLQPQGSSAKKAHLKNVENGQQVMYDSAAASAMLREARHDLRNGEITLSDYQRLSDSILESPGFAPQKSFVSLSKNGPPVSYVATEQDRDSHAQTASGFPSSNQEEQYLQGLDAYLAGSAAAPRAFAHNTAGRNIERGMDRDRDMALRNPVSVYNWLRKHQPQVFLQDNEVQSEKPARGTTARSSKRASAPIKQELEPYDDDGIAVDIGNNSRGKRKRDDDGGYRPKGGNSRPTKRRKDESMSSAKKAKKPASATSAAS
jgi:IEC3 subunit of the Ino80 complex, chromatin re-modelling